MLYLFPNLPFLGDAGLNKICFLHFLVFLDYQLHAEFQENRYSGFPRKHGMDTQMDIGKGVKSWVISGKAEGPIKKL